MTRHSKNNTAGAFYSYAERHQDSENSGFGSKNKRLSKDSVGEFDCCSLSLQICKDPVCTPDGVIYEREAIITYMVEQKQKIAATRKRKLKAEAEKDVVPKKKVFKGESTKDVSKERFGTSTNCFWEPATEPEADKSAFKSKDVEKVCDPVTGNALKLKHLFTVKFTALDPKMTDQKRQGSKARWKCPITGDVLANKIPCYAIKKTGDIITAKALEIVRKDMIFPIGDVALKESDFVALRRGGTGFASANKELQAKLYRPVMQA